MALPSDSEFWIFGYGSLIWKPPPHFGPPFFHRFAQHSLNDQQTVEYQAMSQDIQDHRGTPEAPGRVVTLIERSFWDSLDDPHPSGSDKVWGTAYRIEASHIEEVREYLDIREINGYTIHFTPFHPADGSTPIPTVVYIGTPDNDQFMGPQDPQALAEHIYRSEGPSGLNKDYLLSLETALDGLSAESGDGHIKDLSKRVREFEARQSEHEKERNVNVRAETGGVVRDTLDCELRKADSMDENEETEK